MENKNIRAVIFDLDGTLADTMPEITRAMNRTLRHYNFPERSYSEMRNCINYGFRELIRLAFPPHCTPEMLCEALKLYQKNYSDLYLETEAVYDGIYNVLDHLKKQGYRLGVISNKTHDFTVALTKKLFGDETFEVIIGQGQFERKPAPDIGYHVAQLLSLSTDQIIFIGDSHVDLHFARNSGMVPISVTWGYRDEDVLIKEGAKLLARSPLELVPIIDKLSG